MASFIRSGTSLRGAKSHDRTSNANGSLKHDEGIPKIYKMERKVLVTEHV